MASEPIVVAGGGPAGVAAAIGLVRSGHAVKLVSLPRGMPAVEGLSERTLAALETAGCTSAAGRATIEVRREALWNGRANSFNREWLVDRTAFDRALLDDARAAGVEVVAARAGRPEERPEQGPGGWRLPLEGNGVPAALDTGFLIEARGRRSFGRRRRGPATLALAQRWQGVPPGARTALAALPFGWAWLASRGDGSALLQLVVSAEDKAGRTLGPARLLDQARGLLPTGWLGAGRPLGRPFGRDASHQRSAALIGSGRIRIGDAALALDPLSGHGVFEALASAGAAVAVVNSLRDPEGDHVAARAFYRGRVAETFLRTARVARDFYRLETRWADAPFWLQRTGWPDAQPAHAAPGDAAPRLILRPVLEDGRIVRRRVVWTADHPRGVWQVAGVRLAELRDLMAEGGTPQEAARRLERPPEAVGQALAWLSHRGLLARG
jgi:flavin-dependent dehydrogenase